MKITKMELPIRSLVDGFIDEDEGGVYGYGGLLTIRPEYQREFVYKPDQQREVINSVFKNFPLNVMYWVKRNDETFEMLDGQQRTLSICNYYTSDFAVVVEGEKRFIENLTPEQRRSFLDYKLQIYICEECTEKEILDWFRVINIAGEKLTDQELLNATYHGAWVTSAKKTFSKTGCFAFNKGARYLSGVAIRQEYLEEVLSWACDKDGIEDVETYMARHQFDQDAEPLKEYFTNVIDWVESLFEYDKFMKGLPWGILYNKYKDNHYDPAALRARVNELMSDVEVTKYANVYEYLLGGEQEPRLLSLRSFDEPTKRKKYKEQNGCCAICGKPFKYKEMQGDHIIPWSRGGTTVESNCQMLCTNCNLAKSNH